MAIVIHVEDFQSIAKQTLVVEGFTTITGGNNIGKSAFRRAVHALCENRKGHRFVRYGAAFCTVQISFEDGATVTWQKGRKGVNRYHLALGGKVKAGEGVPEDDDPGWVHNVGHGVPDNVARHLRMAPVEIGSYILWPQFVNRADEQIFLLDKPGSVLGEAIANVERVGLLNKSLKIAESDRRRVRSVLQVRRDDEKEVEEKLKQFEGLDQVETLVVHLGVLHSQADKARRAYTELSRIREGMQQEQSILSHLEGIDSAEVPGKDLFEELSAIYAELDGLRGLRSAISQATTVVQEALRWEGLFSDVDLNLEEQEVGVRTAGEALGILREIQEDISSVSAEISALESEESRVSSSLDKTRKDLEELLQGLSECPVCGTPTKESSHVH